MVAEPTEKKRSTPDFRPGDTVRVSIKVVEGDSERLQAFEGTVISRRGSGESQSFTVRKISFGVGVERTFPLSSPHIEKIDVVKSGRVRRARLYYLRNLTGRAARLTEEDRGDSKAPEGKASGEARAAHASADNKAKAAKPEAAPVRKAEAGKEPRAQAAAPARD